MARVLPDPQQSFRYSRIIASERDLRKMMA